MAGRVEMRLCVLLMLPVHCTRSVAAAMPLAHGGVTIAAVLFVLRPSVPVSSERCTLGLDAGAATRSPLPTSGLLFALSGVPVCRSLKNLVRCLTQLRRPCRLFVSVAGMGSYLPVVFLRPRMPRLGVLCCLTAVAATGPFHSVLVGYPLLRYKILRRSMLSASFNLYKDLKKSFPPSSAYTKNTDKTK